MEAVGRLAGGVAHDFNNLLTVVSGYAHLFLRRLPPGDPLLRPAEQIRSAAERASALTRQLLSFGRKQVIQPRVLDINAAVAEAEGVLRGAIGEDIELRTRLEAGTPWVRTDAGQLEQVLLNLALNARDAMPEGGRLTIETADERVESDASLPAGPYVRLTLSDTGTGIPREIRDKIFDPFFTTKEKSKAAGLGLTTVYGIVQQWGGHVRVDSEPGKGTAFHVVLPREPAPRDLSPGLPDAGPLPSGSETILLVEDEAAVRELTREILEASGYKVLEAEDAEAAARLCRQPGSIDLLLTDVVMPRIGGRELSLRLGALRPGLKVLFMSGHTDDEVLRQGVAEGAAFLQKPFGPEALVRKVRELLDAP
jgi:CheY-like chemotaxis protein